MALVGLINLVPAVGALSSDRIATAYGVAVEGPDLALLLRHRAALFGIVGGLAMVGAVHAPWRGPGAVAAGVSMGSFLVLGLLVPGHGPALRRVVVADVVGLGLLGAAVLMDVLAARS